MIIVNKNEGKKIPYELTGAKLCFDDDLTINMAKRQEDWDVHIDICYDENKTLVIGASAGRSYVAEIDIPAKEYVPGETEADEPVPVPLDTDKVTLSLWAIDEEE